MAELTDGDAGASSEPVEIGLGGVEPLRTFLKNVSEFADPTEAVLVVEDDSLRVLAMDVPATTAIRSPDIDVDADGDVAIKLPADVLYDKLDWLAADPTLVVDGDEGTLRVPETLDGPEPVTIEEPGEHYQPDKPAYYEEYNDVEATVSAWRFIGAVKTVAGPAHLDLRLSACADEIKIEGDADSKIEPWPVSRYVDAKFASRPASVHDSVARWGASLLADAADLLPCDVDRDLEVYWSAWKPLTMRAGGWSVSVAPRVESATQDDTDATEGFGDE